MALIFIGIVLNGFHIVDDQPGVSFAEDPAHRLAAERQANYHFFQLQRARLLERQKRVGQYAWLVLAVLIATSWWLYADAVKATTASKQISALQTFALADSKEAVLSLTLNDGSNIKYLVKAAQSQNVYAAERDEALKKSVQKLELASLKSALNVGDTTLPLGIALKMAN
ncbi:MAG TPA: hypothetical protein VHV54_21535 [Candidatus Binatia bacterium]|nr:hypothetical protein [Candidatus Binatia bacterium]